MQSSTWDAAGIIAAPPTLAPRAIAITLRRLFVVEEYAVIAVARAQVHGAEAST
jgi:hypothetical protein